MSISSFQGNHSHIILQAEDRIISSFGDKNNAMPSSIKPTNLDFNLLSSSQQSTLKTPDRTFENVVGNKQWNVMQMPLNYLNGNWPIRVKYYSNIIAELTFILDQQIFSVYIN